MIGTLNFSLKVPYTQYRRSFLYGGLEAGVYFCPILKDLAKTSFKIIVSL